jgi:hypothetical protein
MPEPYAAPVGIHLSDILRIPGPLDVIFRPWGFRGNEVRSQPTR